MTEMIDRVAMVIATVEQPGDPEEFWNNCDKSLKDSYRMRATAAISAMRSPTDDMVKVGVLPPSRLIGVTRDDPKFLRARWSSMIDCALGRKFNE